MRFVLSLHSRIMNLGSSRPTMIFIMMFVFFGQVFSQLSDFEVPDALIEVLSPRGLRVSIPDQDGIKLFAFHAKVNEEMNGREGGTFSRDVTKPKNGRWTFYDPYAKLNIGDVLYYWTYVDYFDGRNKLGYTKDDQMFKVQTFIAQDPVTSRPTTSTSTPTSTRTPPMVVQLSGEPAQVCNPAETEIEKRTASICSGQLVFDETFDSLNRQVWMAETKFAGKPHYEFVLYENRPETLSVRDGKLVIRPILTETIYGTEMITSTTQGLNLGDKCTGSVGTDECNQTPVAFLILPPVTSSQITSKQGFAFKYGKIEVRAKLPSGDWIYPELTLRPKYEKYGSGLDSGEIKIAFLEGNAATSNVFYGGIVLGTNTAARNYGLKNIRQNPSRWNEEYHSYWIIWRKDHISVGVDSTTYGNIYPPNGGFASEKFNLGLRNAAERWKSGTSLAPFDDWMYISIGVGVGGNNFKDRMDGSKPWNNNDPKAQLSFYNAKQRWKSTWNSLSALEVDYIRVWAV